jgi:hypothetical protein
MIFPWMFDEIHALKPFKDVAHILSEKKDWSRLYDIQALNNNKVVYSAVITCYFDFVHTDLKLIYTWHAILGNFDRNSISQVFLLTDYISFYDHRYLLQLPFTMKTCM